MASSIEWILSKLGGGRAVKTTPVCYLRENGPIAYELPLFDGAAREHVEAMLAADLAWHWKSPPRDWTQLTRWSVAALLTDLGPAAGASDGVVIPGAVILGIDATDAPGDISDDIAASWIRTFAWARGGPLHVVITRAADTNDLVFVAQHPPDSVRTLLHGWAIDRDRAERRAYARLRDAALERVPDKLKPR